MEPSEPVYQRIEAFSGRGELLRKLQEGGGDWLGQDTEGRFVFGYPKRSGGMIAELAAVVKRAEGHDDTHTVQIAEPGSTITNPFPDEGAARMAFQRRIDEVRHSERIRIVVVRRLVAGNVVEEEVVVPQSLERAFEHFLDSQSLTFLGVIAGLVLTFGVSFAGFFKWWVGLVAAVGSLLFTLGVLRWAPSRRGLVHLAAWALRRTY